MYLYRYHKKEPQASSKDFTKSLLQNLSRRNLIGPIRRRIDNILNIREEINIFITVLHICDVDGHERCASCTSGNLVTDVVIVSRDMFKKRDM